MSSAEQWGRRESLIWPPRGYLYTLGALFLAVVFTGFLVWLRVAYGLSPLERYYLPYYLRTETLGTLHPAGAYQLVLVQGGKSQVRPALNADVQRGKTLQAIGKPLPFALSDKARKDGYRVLFRETPHRYSNKALHTWISRWIYGDRPIWRLFFWQFAFGLAAFLIQLPLSIPKDIRRLKDLRYGRRLKGPILVSPKDFNKEIAGDGIGITTHRAKQPLRIPRDAS